MPKQRRAKGDGRNETVKCTERITQLKKFCDDHPIMNAMTSGDNIATKDYNVLRTTLKDRLQEEYGMAQIRTRSILD